MINFKIMAKAMRKSFGDYCKGINHAKSSIQSDLDKIKLLYAQARVPLRAIARTSAAIPLKAVYVAVIWPAMMPVELVGNCAKEIKSAKK